MFFYGALTGARQPPWNPTSPGSFYQRSLPNCPQVGTSCGHLSAEPHLGEQRRAAGAQDGAEAEPLQKVRVRQGSNPDVNFNITQQLSASFSIPQHFSDLRTTIWPQSLTFLGTESQAVAQAICPGPPSHEGGCKQCCKQFCKRCCAYLGFLTLLLPGVREHSVSGQVCRVELELLLRALPSVSSNTGRIPCY